MKHILFAFALLSAPISAQEPASEREVLEAVIDIAKTGQLGFEMPEGWTWEYVPNYGACMRLLTTSCALVQSDAPLEESENTRTIWAATNRSTNHTIFFKGSALPRSAQAGAYVKPGSEGSVVTFVGPHEMTASEMAAYVIGHEVHGHLVEDLDGTSMDEMVGNFYGFAARRALRAIEIDSTS